MRTIAIALAAFGLTLLASPAGAAEVPSPAQMEVRLKAAPVRVEVREPHFGSALRTYLAYPARDVLDAVLAPGWDRPGNSIRFKALDGFVSVVDAGLLRGPDAYLALGLADGGPFTVDNALQNETNVALGPWYLVWDNVRNTALADGALTWPYQVSEVEVAEPGDDQLFPAGLDARYKAGGKLVQANCLTCHKVNGYGGAKLDVNLAEVAKGVPRADFLTWVLSPRSVKPDTTMPGLPPEWPQAEREAAAAAIHDYLVNVPVLPSP